MPRSGESFVRPAKCTIWLSSTRKTFKGQSGVTCYEKSLAKREIYPLANPAIHMASWDIFQVAIPNSRYFEKLWLIPNWLLWIVIALPWHLRLRFFFSKKPIHWSMYCTIPWLNHRLLSSAPHQVWNFKKPTLNTRSHQKWKTRKWLHIFFMVPSTYVGSVQTWYLQHMNIKNAYHTIWCCRNPKANNLEMSKKPLLL